MPAPNFSPPLAGAAPNQTASWDDFLAEVQRVIDAIYGDKADAGEVNDRGVKFYNSPAEAIDRQANLLASGIQRIFTLENYGAAVRARNSTDGALFDSVPYWGISRRLTTVEAVEAALATALQRANHTGTQPISTIAGLSAALDGLSQARIDGDIAVANTLNQNGVKFYDSSAQAISNGANMLPSGIVRIMTIESWGVAVRSRNNPADGLYGTVPYWGISRRLTTEEAVNAALAEALTTEAAARDAAIAAAVDGEAQARVAGDDAEALARQQALTTEAAARDAAIAAAVDGEAQARVAADTILQGQIDTRAPLTTVDRIGLADLDRPGEDPSRWSTVTTGAPEARPALTIGTVVNADYGAVLRITGADIPAGPGFIDVAPRRAYALEAGRIYMLRTAFARAVNPADPSGDSIEVRLRNLSATKAHVSNVRLGDPHSLTVADGIRTVSVLISRAGGADVDYTPPATARYVSPFLRIYGVGQATDAIFVQWADVTDYVLGGADVAAIAGQLEEERQARIAGLAAAESSRNALQATTSITLVNVTGDGSMISAQTPPDLGAIVPQVTQRFAFLPVAPNPGQVLLSVNGGPYLPVYDRKGRELVGGEFSSTWPVQVRLAGSGGGTQYRITHGMADQLDIDAAVTNLGRLTEVTFTNVRADLIDGVASPNHILADIPADVTWNPTSTGFRAMVQGVGTNTGPMYLNGDPLLDRHGRALGPNTVKGSGIHFKVRRSGAGGGHWRITDGLVDTADVVAIELERAQWQAVEESERRAADAYIRDVAEEALAKSPFKSLFDNDLNDGIAAAIVSENGVTMAAWDEMGRQLAPKYGRLTDGTDGDNAAFSMLLDDGRALFSLDEQGRLLNQTSTLSGGLYTGTEQDDYAFAMCLDDGRVLFAWDEEGNMVVGGNGGGAVTPPPVAEPAAIDNHEFEALGYSDGTNLMLVGSPDEVAAPLGDYTALRIAPGSENAVRAIIDRPMIGSTSVVLGGRGLLVPADVKILYIIIGLGQSLMVGSQSSTSLLSILSVYPEVLMMSRLDGLSDVRLGLITQDGSGAPALDENLLVGFEPLVAKVGQGSGGRGETPMEGLANELARAAREVGAVYRTVSFTAAMGGTGYAGLKKGTQTWTNMLKTVQRIKDIAEPLGWQVVVPACVVKHGEADQSNANYGANLIEWQIDADTDIKAITGQMADVQFILSQPSTHYNRTPRSVMAMLELHNTSPHHHLCGADYPFGEFFANDLLHLRGPGYLGVGQGQMARAYKQVCWSGGRKSKITQIIAGARTGNTVVLDYEVPVPPLVLDTMQVDDPGQYGFRFWNGATEVAITSIAVTGPAQVTLTLASAPAGTGGRVEYALTGHSGQRLWETRPRGNLRDSDPHRLTFENFPVPNWAVHQPFDL